MQLLSTLLSSGTEYFSVSEKKHAVNAGVITEIDELPMHFYSLLKEELVSDKKANASLDELGLIEEKQRVEKFFDCNYSKFGCNADVTHCGKLGNREVINCPQRLSCKHQCKLCTVPNRLSRRETQVAILTALGMMDDEICYHLEISQSTLRNHKNHIEEKINKTGKIAIGVWANDIGLVYKKE